MEQPWTQLAADDAAAQGGLGSADLGSRLELLAGGVTALEEVGEEEVGVPSVHYRVTVDLPRAPEAAPEDQRAILTELAEQGGITELPFDLWVGEGLVRRMSYRLDLPRAAEGERHRRGGRRRLHRHDRGVLRLRRPLPARASPTTSCWPRRRR